MAALQPLQSWNPGLAAPDPAAAAAHLRHARALALRPCANLAFASPGQRQPSKRCACIPRPYRLPIC